MEHVIAIVALVLTGPLAGAELGVAAFTNPLVSKLPDDAYRVAAAAEADCWARHCCSLVVGVV